jgi:hypothetical protein
MCKFFKRVLLCESASDSLCFMSMSICTCTNIKAIIIWVLLPFKMFIHNSNLYSITFHTRVNNLITLYIEGKIKI